ncbi:gonadotropin-releasing hormone receptor [Caerostris extrusa]|uniref:Gonadotropin-releasing hormone receptor n=1 Tax=Caerostris extrusa TaxID=172846 RepID=A0AAV4WAU8_CAEEX|nr:gonadotropin-releasing hormone receptor [Caerostris extrusa]
MVIEDVNNSLDKIWIEFPTVSVNSSDVPSYDFGPEYHRTVRLYTLFVMFIFSLLGNTLVVKQLLPLTRRRFPKSKVLFLNLAAADLFVTFATMLSQFIWELMDQQWIAGDIVCKLFKFFQTYSLCSSTFMLVAIALDRYNAIVRPLSSSLEPKYYALIAWFVASLPAMPCLIVFSRGSTFRKRHKCVFLNSIPHHKRCFGDRLTSFAYFWSLSYCLSQSFCSVHTNHGRNTCAFLSVHRQSTDCFFFTKGEGKDYENDKCHSSGFHCPELSIHRARMSEKPDDHHPLQAMVISQPKERHILRVRIVKTSSRFDVNALSTVPPYSGKKLQR